MAIQKVKLVNVTGKKEVLQATLLRCIQMDYFHPELASNFVPHVHGLKTLNDENPYGEKMTKLKQVLQAFQIDYDETCCETCESKDILDTEIDTYLNEVEQKSNTFTSVLGSLRQVLQENEDALVQMKNVEGMDINFDDMFSLKYLDVRFGRLPKENVNKLQFHKNHPFVFKEFQTDENYVWCVYLTSNEYAPDVDNIFASYYFERIRIPDFVHGTPGTAIKTLEEEIDSDKLQLAKALKRQDDYITEHKDKLVEIYQTLCKLNKTYEARKYVIGWRNRFSIVGFMAEEDIERFQKDLAGIALDIEIKEPDSDKRLTPPTKLKNRWFARPFEMFVTMYGFPSYSEIDPTPFVAFTYSLLFGIMFGDLGQGLVLIIGGGLLYRKTKMQLAGVAMRIGVFASIFGLIYGSFFGNEEFLNPLYQVLFRLDHKPIEVMSDGFIMPLLIASLLLGIVLIVSSISLNLFIQFKHKHWVEFACSQNGLAGLVFYGSLIAGMVITLLTGVNMFRFYYVIPLLIFPLVLVFLKEGLERKAKKEAMFPNGFGGFAMESFFELFEVVLSFITNSISFLRVGGFVLSHTGMMMVVSILAGEAFGVQYLIVMLLGNIFVMCLEGLVVGIQALRLEFYEMFSRYFNGNGIAFRPMSSEL